MDVTDSPVTGAEEKTLPKAQKSRRESTLTQNENETQHLLEVEPKVDRRDSTSSLRKPESNEQTGVHLSVDILPPLCFEDPDHVFSSPGVTGHGGFEFPHRRPSGSSPDW